MDRLIQYIIYLHAISGFTALMAGGIAMVTSKGKNTHRMAGKFYFAGMTGVFFTAVIVSIYKNIPFLLMIGFFSYHLVCMGYRALYLKKLHLDQKPFFVDWLIVSIAGIFNTLLFAWGIYTKWFFDKNMGIVAIVFGLIGIQTVFAETRRFIQKPTDKNHWLMAHIGGMTGGYIATWTAFLVVNIHFLPPLITWLTPTLIGVPFILYKIKKIKSPAPRALASVK